MNEQPFINVLDFASGSGNVNDGPGIQSAINQASACATPNRSATVFFPTGTYRIDSTVSLISNVILMGSGKGSIIQGNLAGLTGNNSVLEAKGLSNIEVDSLAFECNGKDNALSFLSTSNVKVEFCQFYQPSNPTQGVSCINVGEDPLVSQAETYEGFEITSNFFFPTKHAVRIERSLSATHDFKFKRITLDGNIVEMGKKSEVIVPYSETAEGLLRLGPGTRDFVVTNNILSSNKPEMGQDWYPARDAILIHESDLHGVCNANIISQCQRGGITVASLSSVLVATDLVVSENNIRKIELYADPSGELQGGGIIIYAPDTSISSITVANNIINEVILAGITQVGVMSNNLEITSNLISDSTLFGIYCQAQAASITYNKIRDVNAVGIYYSLADYDILDVTTNQLVIAGNTIRSVVFPGPPPNPTFGIRLVGTSSSFVSTIHSVSVKSNIVRGADYGIEIMDIIIVDLSVQGNQFFEINEIGAVIPGNGSVIQSNRFIRKFDKNAIRLEGSECLVTENDLLVQDGLLPTVLGIDNIGADNVIRNNNGFRTEQTLVYDFEVYNAPLGWQLLPSTISHELSQAPSITDCQVTIVDENPGSCNWKFEQVEVTNADSSSIEVGLNILENNTTSSYLIKVVVRVLLNLTSPVI